MTQLENNMDMEQVVNDYFSSLNFFCKSIVTEKKNFSSLLGDQWNSLPQEDQDALLDEHFIAPHIRQKYGEGTDESLPDMFPVLKIKSGQKVVDDDEGETWQDEHSGPFSWETSSQSEFDIDGDMSSNDVVKQRAKDLKRPKSPRHIRSNSGDIPKPGALERTSSSDFQQLRHIWEAHHQSPEGELLALPSFLSRSQNSLNTASDTPPSTVTAPAAISRMSSSVDSIAFLVRSLRHPGFSMKEREDESEESAQASAPKLAANLKPVSRTSSHPPADTSPVKPEDNKKTIPVAPLATTENDDDITVSASMKDDIIKMSEIQTEIEATMTDTSLPANTKSKPAPLTSPVQQKKLSTKKQSAPKPPEPPKLPTNPEPVSIPVTNQKPPQEPANEKPAQEEDILAKFGITFGYDEGAQQEKPEEEASLPTGFDFLSAW